jgi:serine/threonine protein kinase
MGLEASPPLSLPDGGRPLPLGSGYIASLIGIGAMSNVYKIWNPQLETFRAVKLMKPDISIDSKQRFQTEMKIMAAFSHPNIIEIHSVGEWNGLSFIEMEYIEGFTLAEIIEKKGALPAAACTALCIMVARALMYAHNKDYVLFGKSYRGIIHRDIKPSNLMVTKDGRVKLMDFGIARPVESSLMTMDGAVMGTMQYLAPEQIDGKNVGIPADIYAFGVVLYEMLTGRKAFPQKNLSQLMAAKTGNSFVPLKSYSIRIPPLLKQLVNKCMLYEPKHRMPSASAVLMEVEHAHRRLALDTPEGVICSYLSSPINEKTVLAIRKPMPVRLIVCIVMCVITAFAAYTILASLGKRAKKVWAPISQAPADAKAGEPAASAREKKPDAAPVSSRTPNPIHPKVNSTVKTTPTKSANAIDKKTDAASPATFESFADEVESGSLEKALQLFAKLPPAIAAQQNTQLLRLRALYGLGRTDEVGRIMEARTINDGEYYLIQAKYLVRRGDCDRSLPILDKCITVRARYLDADVVRRDYLYCRALCLSLRFDREPSPENRKAALDGWFEVKNSVRRLPRHRYFNEAVSEMQRVGDMSRQPDRAQGKQATMP